MSQKVKGEQTNKMILSFCLFVRFNYLNIINKYYSVYNFNIILYYTAFDDVALGGTIQSMMMTNKPPQANYKKVHKSLVPNQSAHRHHQQHHNDFICVLQFAVFSSSIKNNFILQQD